MKTNLQNKLENAQISFDCRVRVTDLVEEYQLPYMDVLIALEQYIKRQENIAGEKFVKRYLLQGLDPKNGSYLFSIVDECNVDDWLTNKLDEGSSILHDVELAGGSKATAHIFKPARFHLISVEPKKRQNAGSKTTAARTVDVIKPAPSKVEPSSPTKRSLNTLMDETHLSPTKAKQAKLGNVDNNEKGRINQLFTNAAKKNQKEKQNSSKAEGGAGQATTTAATTSAKCAVQQKCVKSNAPQTVTALFSKQKQKCADKTKAKEAAAGAAAKQPTTVAAKKTANTSVQLFADSDSDEDDVQRNKSGKLAVEDSTSDEEEQIDALRRKVLEAESEDDENEQPTATQRKRIIESDDDDDDDDAADAVADEAEAAVPPKIAAIEAEEIVVDVEPEAYMDDDGFVVTIKSKKKKQQQTKPRVYATKPPAAIVAKKSTTAEHKKTPDQENNAKPKASKKTNATTATAAAAAGAAPKAKQNSIMSYFSKK